MEGKKKEKSGVKVCEAGYKQACNFNKDSSLAFTMMKIIHCVSYYVCVFCLIGSLQFN